MENCGQLYNRIMKELLDGELFWNIKIPEFPDPKYHTDQRDYAFLAAGFIIGQAEKVYLGASEAFIIRPSEEWLNWTKEITELICQNYSLHLYWSHKCREIWAFKHHLTISTLQFMEHKLEVNSPEFHELRARLCGIKEVNREYHKTSGFNERCEP